VAWCKARAARVLSKPAREAGLLYAFARSRKWASHPPSIRRLVELGLKGKK